MLVLTRRLNEVVTIGNLKGTEPPIEATVIEVRGDQVRLGIKAPRETAVHRKEIWEQVQRQNRDASGTDPASVPDVRPRRLLP